MSSETTSSRLQSPLRRSSDHDLWGNGRPRRRPKNPLRKKQHLIWRVASEDYPGAIPIVDLWHAKEKLWEVAKLLFAHDKALVEPWAHARCDDLEQGRLDGLLATLRAHAGTCEEAGKCANYIDKNRERMRYADFRAKGLCVGSGVVESGCRTIVGRLKRSGMYWSVSGANAILALRCCVLSGNYEDFWAERTEYPAIQAQIQT